MAYALAPETSIATESPVSERDPGRSCVRAVPSEPRPRDVCPSASARLTFARHAFAPSSSAPVSVRFLLLFPSSPLSLRLASSPPADDTRIAHLRRLTPQVRAASSPQAYVTYVVPDTLPVGSLLGTICFVGRILLFIRLLFPLSYVFLLLFRPRPPALLASLASFYLAIGHRTSPLSSTLRPPSRLRLQYTYCLQSGHRTPSNIAPRVCRRRTDFTLFFLSLVLPSSAHTACSILVSTTLDSPINTPSLASPKPGSRGLLSLHLYPRLRALRLPTDRRQTMPTRHHLSSHSQTRLLPSLGAVSITTPYQTLKYDW